MALMMLNSSRSARAFSGLMNGLRKDVENALDAVKHDLGFEFAPTGLKPMLFEQGVVVSGVTFNGFQELLHAAENLLPNLFGIPLFAGMGHLDAKFVHLIDKFLGRANAVFEAALVGSCMSVVSSSSGKIF